MNDISKVRENAHSHTMKILRMNFPQPSSKKKFFLGFIEKQPSFFTIRNLYSQIRSAGSQKNRSFL